MDFSAGYASSFRVVRLDHASWREDGVIDRVSSLSVVHSIDSDAPLVDSADLELDSPAEGECYVRVYMDCDQHGSRTSVPLGTFLLESVSGDGPSRTNAELWSVLKPAEERTLPVGWHAVRGTSSAAKAAELVSQCCDCPVSYEVGSPTLAENVVAGEGESYLSMAWALLSDGWAIVPDGLGTVHISKGGSEGAVSASDVIGRISEEWNLSGVPNAITVVESGKEVTVTNSDPSSPTSTVSRGRVIEGDPSGQRNSDETLAMFARRLLREQSTVVRRATYDREYRDDISCGDYVTIPNHEGLWKVVSQSVECGAGAVVSETVEREEETWA
jgi:hypothetical protein